MFQDRIYDQKGAFHIIMVISLLVSNEFETLYLFDNNKERNMLTSIFSYSFNKVTWVANGVKTSIYMNNFLACLSSQPTQAIRQVCRT